jgi:hypothetical protein
MKTFLAVLTFAVALTTFAVAQNSSSVQTPDKPRLPQDLVNYFAGDWSGKGRFTSGRDLESDFSFAPQLENQCVLVHQKEKSPNTFEFSALWNVDSISGDLIMLLAGNHDTGARIFRSHGWQDGRITFQSVPDLRSYWALERFTFERESATVFHSTYEYSKDDGKTWLVGDKQTFTKKWAARPSAPQTPLSAAPAKPARSSA